MVAVRLTALWEDDRVDKVLVRFGGAVVTGARALQVGGILLAAARRRPAVPDMEHLDESFAVIRETASLPAAGDLTELDAIYMPSYDPEVRPAFNVAFNVLGIGPTLQIFGSLVAAATCWGLFYDEINKFFWWPLHLSGYLLIAVPIPLFIGLNTVRDLGVTASLRVGVDPSDAGRHPDPDRHAPSPEPDRHLRRGVAPLSVLVRHRWHPGAAVVPRRETEGAFRSSFLRTPIGRSSEAGASAQAGADLSDRGVRQRRAIREDDGRNRPVPTVGPLDDRGGPRVALDVDLLHRDAGPVELALQPATASAPGRGVHGRLVGSSRRQ